MVAKEWLPERDEGRLADGGSAGMRMLGHWRMALSRWLGRPDAAASTVAQPRQTATPEELRRQDRLADANDVWLKMAIGYEAERHDMGVRALIREEMRGSARPSPPATRTGPPLWTPPPPILPVPPVEADRKKNGSGPPKGPSRLQRLDRYQERLPPWVKAEARVMGTVVVVGRWRPSDRPIVTELGVYLAVHDQRPTAGDTVRTMLWPGDREASEKTFRTYVSLLRHSLGPDLFPEAEKGAGYRLDETVATDWRRFCDQVADADRCERRGDPELATLLLVRALQFVRGTPFAGASGSSYDWAWRELLVHEIERAVTSVGVRVGRAALDADDLELAEWALRRSLLGVPLAAELWDLLEEVATRRGKSALVRVLRDRRAVLGEARKPTEGSRPSLGTPPDTEHGGGRSITDRDRGLEP